MLDYRCLVNRWCARPLSLFLFLCLSISLSFSFSLPVPSTHPATLSREGTSGITISSLHAGWILIEAQRIKLLKIRLSLLVVLLVLLLLAHPPYPSSLPPRITAFRVGRHCEPFFLSRFFISRIFIDSYNSCALGSRTARKESRANA